jgi:hypothetical protein
MSQLRLKILLETITVNEEEGEGQSKKFPGHYHLGGGYYATTKGGEAVKKSDKGQLRQLTPAEKQEKAAEKSGGKAEPTTQQKPATQPKSEKPSKKTNVKAEPTPQKPQQQSKPEPKDTQTPPSVPSSQQEKPKGLFGKIKEKWNSWKSEEKEFFKQKLHKGNTPARRNMVQALRDKAQGAAKGAWKRLKHEAHTFAEAGKGLYNFFALKEVTKEQQSALKHAAKTALLTAATMVAGHFIGAGMAAVGLAKAATTTTAATGAGKAVTSFLTHMGEHVAAEITGGGVLSAAINAGEEERDPEKQFEKFMELVYKKLETDDVPPHVMEKIINDINSQYEDAAPTTSVTAEDIRNIQKEIAEIFKDTEFLKEEMKKQLMKGL